jgi:hypothetical protein
MKKIKYPIGIYDNYYTGISVKIVAYSKYNNMLFAILQFTRNPYYNDKSYFEIPVKQLKKFLQGYTKRK